MFVCKLKDKGKEKSVISTMFRYIVALLLINSYSGSWGAPTQNTTMFLSTLLNDLSNKCGNPFLATQMKNRIKDCEVPVPPYHKKQFECLLFYDINRQLCEAVASFKLALTEDYSSKILAEQDVSQLCKIAKDWTFTNMSVVYNQTVNSLFGDPLKCFKFCILSSDNLLSVDSTFYCKYYKWGSEMLKTQISTKKINEKTGIVAQITSENVSVKNAEPNSNPAETHEVEIEKPVQSDQDIELKQPDTSNSKNTLNNIISTQNVNLELIPTENKGEVSSTSDKQQENIEHNSIHLRPQVEAHIPAAKPPLFTNEEQQPAVLKDLIPKELSTTTVSQSGSNKDKKEDAGIIPKHVPNQDNNMLNQAEIQKPSNNGDPDDYQPNDDSEDTQGGDDADDGLDTKLDEEINKKPIINEPPVYNNDIAPKETYSNTNSDFDEEDDHFFPFFLTAIIMVVLIYILYHNKNKVSKVVLGLIVEGRQPGRRRNSRGHAYRRLDTLEQAMSTNTSAPPSKIIY